MIWIPLLKQFYLVNSVIISDKKIRWSCHLINVRKFRETQLKVAGTSWSQWPLPRGGAGAASWPDHRSEEITTQSTHGHQRTERGAATMQWNDISPSSSSSSSRSNVWCSAGKIHCDCRLLAVLHCANSLRIELSYILLDFKTVVPSSIAKENKLTVKSIQILEWQFERFSSRIQL